MQINNNILHSIDLKENRMTLKRIGKQGPNQLSSNLNIFKVSKQTIKILINILGELLYVNQV